MPGDERISLQDHFDGQLECLRREISVRAEAQDKALNLVAENLRARADQQASTYRTLIAVLGLVFAIVEVVLQLIRH